MELLGQLIQILWATARDQVWHLATLHQMLLAFGGNTGSPVIQQQQKNGPAGTQPVTKTVTVS
jgi:hypothetical protein